MLTDLVFGDHLFGDVDVITAARTAFTFRRFESGIESDQVGRGRDVGRSGDGDQSGHVAVAETLGSVTFAVVGLAVDLTVGAVAGQHRVQWPVAVGAVEAQFVPFLFIRREIISKSILLEIDCVPYSSFGEHLLSRKDRSAASRAALAFGGLD